MNDDTQIVVGPDGIVLAASGELSAGLVDRRLEDVEALPPEVRKAAAAVLTQLRQSAGRLASVRVALEDARRVEIVAIEVLAIRRAPVDLRELLPSKLAVLFSQATAEDVTLTVDVAEDVPPTVRVDAEKLAWAVTTLVGNALRYVRSGSRRMPGKRIAVRVECDRSAEELIVEVRDDGPGIPLDTVTRLFKRDGLNVRGAGLALLLMSDICSGHGGKVEVRSSTDGPNHGTTARLVFPMR
jgi:signal transduction histidine kinase